MASSNINTSIDLNLPSTPRLTNPPEAYQELFAIYNAIRSLATGLDDYTDGGELLNRITALEATINSAFATLKRSIKGVKQDLEEVPNYSATLFELRKQYYRYTVPKFTVTTDLNVKAKFSLGDPAIVPPVGVQTITKTSATCPANGAGVLAGAFDSASSRDTAIAAINANSAAITEVQNFLKLFGFLKT